MSDYLARAEEHRDLVAGLEYEEYHNRFADDPAGWRDAVLQRDRGCIVHDDPLDCDGPLQAHHVVTQQHLRKRKLPLWDPRIGVAVCEKAHRRHTSAVERISVECIPCEVLDYVAELGLGWMLERYYRQEAA